MPPKPKPVMLDVDGVEVKLTNPDKIYFPELGADGGRKGDLVDYYRTMASTGPLLDAIGGRPTFLQRFPDGVEGEQIYQKHLPKYHPEHVDSTKIVFPSKRSGQAFCPRIAADVVWAANLGTFTFHTWPTTAPDNDHPDQLRIDLDPSDSTTFDDVRRLAGDLLRPLLDELGMTGFAKTSGSRGVHVFVPIRPEWDFIATRRAVIALGRELERRAPDTVTTSWWKEERGERIFIDYNQNARDRSMASPYSARKSARARVSTPVTWDELVDVDPDDLTIATVPKLVAERGDPWADIHEHRSGLENLLEMVERDEANGLGDMVYPPNYPKMPGEPPRVPPSKMVAEHWDADGNRVEPK
ncbi:DNA primase small subunit domain-containing protein [Gordonia sp. (in: high G+C Gram-positive bacteria)]|uniref:DNA polymerase domain-containing protein n=1 Tax=Gordonia sp. (in: high G+C Gram-positive bacteria) TaxID=84139 RepID=UPI00168DDF58|nr:DNA primase small subunit domain-containing protein [Gordonia sp. (in: high G+C Gram-positive bacteria)]NLG48264.1 ATP-dependent DNA ligase [Gordonia sp. (in: high G+C Gram-positive bacteria)]